MRVVQAVRFRRPRGAGAGRGGGSRRRARSGGGRGLGGRRALPRGGRKLDLARQMGAGVVVDYSEPAWPDRVLEVTAGRGPDLVFDNVGGKLGRAAFGITARGGRLSAHGAPSGGFARIGPREAEHRGVTVRGIEQVQHAPAASTRLVARALAEAAAGRIRPVIGHTFPLERAAAAHAAIEARTVIGKTLLLCRAPTS
jgi:NADPH:quinone reductase